MKTGSQIRIKAGWLAVWISAAAVILAAAIRYLGEPTFWLDEAFIAESLRDPRPGSIFAPLEHGQYFPRLYLAAIAFLREAIGYRIWVLRLLPLLSFAAGTLLWARLLAKRSSASTALGIISASLLIGSHFWLDQAIQLKQYSFDVALALAPFTVGDALLEESLAHGKRKAVLVALAMPSLLSYTYPLALAARVLGWYIDHGRKRGWRLNAGSLLVLAVCAATGVVGIWLTDHQFNIIDRAAYMAYWDDCILRSRLTDGIGGAPRLLAKFFWGWHGRMPLVTAGMIPLQILGLYSILRRWRKREPSIDDSDWGSRSLGSLLLLSGVIFASLVAGLPICAGRVMLFTQVHTQILALEGALLVLTFGGRRKAALAFLYVFIAVLLFHSGREYARFVRSEPTENLRPVLGLIKPELAPALWVHPCSTSQVKSLPEALPVSQVLFGKENRWPERGQKCWVLWSHMGEDSCRRQLDEIRSRAHAWRVIADEQGRGLALAEF